MKNFVQILQQLTQTIQNREDLAPFAFNLVSLVKITDKERSQLKLEAQDIELIHVDAFWELTEVIYKKLMLPTIATDLQDYFFQLQQVSHKKLKITYEFILWEKFRLITTSLEKEALLTRIVKLETTYAEEQLEKFLNHIGINDTSWKSELYDFDYAFNFESTIETLFRDLAFVCWQKSKEQTKTKTIGCISEVKGGSYTYNLDNGTTIDEL